jgi:acyl carrier protein
MPNTKIFDRLTPIFQDVFDDDDLIPTAEMTAADVDEWDSLSHIRLIVAVEQIFNIKFSVPEIERLKNVGDFANMIAGKIYK